MCTFQLWFNFIISILVPFYHSFHLQFVLIDTEGFTISNEHLTFSSDLHASTELRMKKRFQAQNNETAALLHCRLPFILHNTTGKHNINNEIEF